MAIQKWHTGPFVKTLVCSAIFYAALGIIMIIVAGDGSLASPGEMVGRLLFRAMVATALLGILMLFSRGKPLSWGMAATTVVFAYFLVGFLLGILQTSGSPP